MPMSSKRCRTFCGKDNEAATKPLTVGYLPNNLENIRGEFIIMRYLLVAFSCLLLGACQSLTAVSILPGAYSALTKQIEVAPAFFQNVATAYAKTNDEYKFLTSQSCSELGTRSIRAFNALKLERVVKGKKQRLTYSEYEAERLNIQTKSFRFLADFAAQMDARAKAAEEFAKGTGYFVTGAEIAASVPVVGVQATAYAAATKAVVGVLNSAVAGATVEELVRIAQKIEPDSRQSSNR
jgi:hypothetical protein